MRAVATNRVTDPGFDISVDPDLDTLASTMAIKIPRQKIIISAKGKKTAEMKGEEETSMAQGATFQLGRNIEINQKINVQLRAEFDQYVGLNVD